MSENQPFDNDYSDDAFDAQALRVLTLVTINTTSSSYQTVDLPRGGCCSSFRPTVATFNADGVTYHWNSHAQCKLWLPTSEGKKNAFVFLGWESCIITLYICWNNLTACIWWVVNGVYNRAFSGDSATLAIF
jgi:hypothetical protein